MPLPLVGNLVSVIFKLRKEKYHHKLWQSWARQYGELLGLRLGIVNVVIVSGRDYIKEVSSREAFEGRPDGFFYTLRSFGKKIGKSLEYCDYCCDYLYRTSIHNIKWIQPLV